MDKRFPPPTDGVVTAVSLLMQVICESAKLAADTGDDVGVRLSRSHYRYLDQVYDAMLDRQRGATVH
jgi:hypothetical protein